MKIFYYGPPSRPGAHIGAVGELRIVSLVGLWDKVQAAMLDGAILRLAHEPTMAYLQTAGVERQCLLCATVLNAETAPLSMMVFVLPYQPDQNPVMVSALCKLCCDAERDDDRLLLQVETVLQQDMILSHGLGEAPLTLTRQQRCL
jgi:hypothetical protein